MVVLIRNVTTLEEGRENGQLPTALRAVLVDKSLTTFAVVKGLVGGFLAANRLCFIRFVSLNAIDMKGDQGVSSCVFRAPQHHTILGSSIAQFCAR